MTQSPRNRLLSNGRKHHGGGSGPCGILPHIGRPVEFTGCQYDKTVLCRAGVHVIENTIMVWDGEWDISESSVIRKDARCDSLAFLEALS